MLPFLNQLDQSLIVLITGLPIGLRPFMQLMSALGQPVIMGITVGMVALVGFRRSQSGLVYAGIWAFAGIIASNILKLLLRRTRPDTYVPVVYHSYSFPSGHAMGSTIALGLLAWLAIHYLAAPWGYVAAVACGLFVLLVGLSRVYLGAHYPTDVLGGWALGLLALGCIIKFVKL